MTIYDIPAMVGNAFPRAVTPANILSGFRVSGISPFDRFIFNDDDFLPSAVTDMPNPHQSLTTTIATVNQDKPSGTTVSTAHQPPETNIAIAITQGVDANVLKCLPSTSNASGSVSSTSISIYPEHVRPFPTACPRKGIRRGRKPGRTRVLADTPEKNAIIQEQQPRSRKAKCGAKATSVARALVVSKKAKPTPANDDDSCPCLVCDEPFSNSLPGEKWAQCTACKMWAHTNCLAINALCVTCQ